MDSLAEAFVLSLTDPITRAVFLFLTLAVFSIFSKKKNLLDNDGILIANIVGIAIYLLGGMRSFYLIVFFFIAAEAATKFGRVRINKHEKRKTGNILGNSSAAVLALFFYSTIGFYGAVSAALADTLSSEIGLMSKKKPVLITTWKEVEHGTDGGITLLGCGAALLGSTLIGLIHLMQFQDPWMFLVIVACGFIGSLMDSVFGALFELKHMLNNAEVNFLGSASGALVAVLLKSLKPL